ncbi:MAG TPA: PIN domain-containing protein [Bryobacteraceae bacterium]
MGLDTDAVVAAMRSPTGASAALVIALAEPVETHFLWRPQLRDPNDEMVLEAAINGNADALVTFNVRHFEDSAAQFGLAVMLPREAIRRIGE